MARVRIELPEDFSFSVNIPVRITDLNYGGHVGNDRILSLVHEARIAFLQHHGYSEMDLGGTAMIMSDAMIEFKSELFFGDDLRIYVKASSFSRVGFELFYKLVKGTGSQVVAIVKTGMVCYDYKAKKVTPVPAEVMQRLSS